MIVDMQLMNPCRHSSKKRQDSARRYGSLDSRLNSFDSFSEQLSNKPPMCVMLQMLPHHLIITNPVFFQIIFIVKTVAFIVHHTCLKNQKIIKLLPRLINFTLISVKTHEQQITTYWSLDSCSWIGFDMSTNKGFTYNKRR